MQPRLIGLKAPVMGLTVNLSPSETTLGREVGNTVVLNSSSVSRRHARIVPQGDGYAIEDLGSANGTRVNGVPAVGLTALNNGDRVDLGEISLLFEAPVASSVAVSAPSPRKPEVGSAERAAQFASPSRDDASGCNPLGSLLNDLSGALPGLMKYILPVLLGLLALFCLGSLVMMGVGALSQMLNHGGSSSPSSAPPASKPPGSPPPAQNSQSSQQDSGSAKISILSTSVVKVAGTDHPTLLVKWRNDSDQPVAELDGTVVVHMSDGRQDTYPKMRIYLGAPVAPGQTHEDTGTGDGVVIATDVDPKPDVIPTEVK